MSRSIIIRNTLKRIHNNLSEVIFVILAGLIIGAIAAFIEIDSESEVGQIIDRLDKAINCIKKDMGR